MATEIPQLADEIQRQMQSVRSSLRADVKELVENARDMTDWHYYVRRYPLACLATAAIVGYGLTAFASQRTTIAPPQGHPPRRDGDNSQSFPLSGFHSPRLDPPVASPPVESSVVNRLISKVAGMASAALTRTAISFATQQVNKLVAAHLLSTPESKAQGEDFHAQSHL